MKPKILNKITNINSDIIDTNGDNDQLTLGAIQLNIDFIYNNNNYVIELQTSDTFDVGAVSSDLRINKSTSYAGDYFSFKSAVEEDLGITDYEAEEVIEEAVKKLIIKVGAQKAFNDYVKENYNQESYFGIDANSESNFLSEKH